MTDRLGQNDDDTPANATKPTTVDLARWASSYNAYRRIAAGPENLTLMLSSILDCFSRDGTVPEWIGLDALRAWAFYLLRKHHFSDYDDFDVQFPEVKLIAAAVENHPDATDSDRPSSFTFPDRHG